MKQWLKKYLCLVLLVVVTAGAAYLGRTAYTLSNIRDGLVEDLDAAQNRYQLLKRKYAEEKAQVALLQRSKRAVEGELGLVRNDLAEAQKEKEAMAARMAGMEADVEKKTAALRQRIEQYAERMEKLRALREEDKATLAEYAKMIRDRNASIEKLTAEKSELSNRFQETASTLKRCEKHNVDLVRITEELVEKYRNKGVGDSLAQIEPFTQIEKVQVEKIVQEYLDRIDDGNLEILNQKR